VRYKEKKWKILNLIDFISKPKSKIDGGEDVSRPGFVTGLAILYAIGGILFLFVFPGLLGMYLTREFVMLFQLIGLLDFLIAYGLWIGKSWAWWLAITFAVMNIIASIFSLPRGLSGIAFSAIIIYFLVKPEVKEYFGV